MKKVAYGIPWLLFCALLFLITWQTTAAYRLSETVEMGEIGAKAFVLKVDGASGSRSMGLSIRLSPGEEQNIPLSIDPTDSEVAMNVSVELDAAYSGALPPGFSVKLDDEKARDEGKKLVAKKSYSALRNEAKKLVVTVRWDDPGEIDYQKYQDFSMDLTLDVLAVQA